MDAREISREHKIWEVIAGSHLYGTNIATSDMDVRGIFIAPLIILLDPFHNIEQCNDEKQDQQLYELKKFFYLFAQNNPNIIELMWVPEKKILFSHPVMDILLSQREAFLSTKVRHTFAGYAISQLKRIKGHKRWIVNPQPEDPPDLREYVRFIGNTGLEISDAEAVERLCSESATKVNEHIYKIWSDSSNRLRKGFLEKGASSPQFIDIDLRKLDEIKPQFCGIAFIQWEEYKADLKKWRDYWDWKTKRNEDRARLEEVSGYDTKHAMHLVRLMRMAKEILVEGKVIVERQDAEELLEIRHGKWTYEQVIQFAEESDKEMEELAKRCKILPKSPDLRKIHKIYLQMLEFYFEVKLAR